MRYLILLAILVGAQACTTAPKKPVKCNTYMCDDGRYITQGLWQ